MQICKICNGRYGEEYPTMSIEIKEKISNTFRDKYGDTYTPNIGFNEKQLLDEQEKIDNCVIDRHFKVGPYYPDGYCHETNTIYEVYEKHHFTVNKTIEKDIKRQNYIESKLNCKFSIIKDAAHR